MRLKAWSEGLLFLVEALLLEQKFFLLGDQPTDFFAQLGERFL